MTVSTSLRRRLDYLVLRWQARLDGAWADRVIPWAAMAGLFVVFAALALARVRSFETGDDLATWVQGAWLITHGLPADSTVTGRHLLEPQFAVGFYAVAQLTRILPTTVALVLLQSLALSLGVPAVWRICRQVCTLRVGAAMGAVFAYAVHPVVHQLNLADVHPEALAVPALLWGAYFALRGRWRWAAPLFVVAVAMRSDLGLTVAAIGLCVALSGRGAGGRRLAAAGFAWTVVAQLVIQPAIGDGAFIHEGAFRDYGEGILGVVWGMVTHPWEVIGDVASRDDLELLVALLLPVALVPLASLRRLLPFAPVVALFLVADVPIGGAEGVELLIPGLIGVFVSLPFGLEQLGRRNIERVTVDRRLLTAMGLVGVVFFALLSPASPYEHPWEWGSRDEEDHARRSVASELDDDARVRADPSVLAELAEREVARPVSLDRPRKGDRSATPSAQSTWPSKSQMRRASRITGRPGRR